MIISIFTHRRTEDAWSLKINLNPSKELAEFELEDEVVLIAGSKFILQVKNKTTKIMCQENNTIGANIWNLKKPHYINSTLSLVKVGQKTSRRTTEPKEVVL